MKYVLILALFFAICAYLLLIVKRFVSLFVKPEAGKLRKALFVFLCLAVIVALVAFIPASLPFFMYAALISLCCEPFYVLFSKKRHTAILKKSAAVPVIGSLIITIIGFFMMTSFVKTEYTVTTDKLASGEQIRLLFIADLHYGNAMHGKHIKKLVEIWNTEHYDAVIIGGDLVDESSSAAEIREVIGALGKLQTEYGVFFIYGNHESIGGMTDEGGRKGKVSSEELLALFQDAGIAVLSDETALVGERIKLYGRRDSSMQREKLENLVWLSDPQKYVLIADHQPTDFHAAAACGADMIVSGHTHAGQFWPIGLIHEPLGFNDLVYGKRQFGSMTAIVSSGLSGWYAPVRTEGRSEYVVITIKGQ